jgi:dihydroneopterin aldolase
MSKITITDLEVYFCVGVPAEERAQPQRLLLTIEMDYDFNVAAANDEISATIDYFDVAKRLTVLGNNRSWKLIETLSNDVATFVLANYPASAVTVLVKKFPIPNAAQVSVTLKKHR